MTTPVWSDSCAADPEPPPDDGDGDLAPWCKWPRDLYGQHASTDRLDAMTVLTVREEYL